MPSTGISIRINMAMSADEGGGGFVRTTVSLREDLYQQLRRSPKGISETLNEILARAFERDHSLFGTAPRGLSTDDLRDHEDRD